MAPAGEKFRSFIHKVLIGGGSLVLWPILEMVPRGADLGWARFDQTVLIVGAVLALLAYQPHFISTYLFNYGRGWGFIRKHAKALLLFPVVLAGLLTFLGFQFASSPSAGEPLALKWILLITLLYAVVHFASQAAAITVLHCSGDVEARERRYIKFGLIAVGCAGLLRHMEIQGGFASLFGVTTPQLSFGVLPFILYSAGLVLNLLFFIRVRPFLTATALIPWMAFEVWYSSTSFLTHFFYLIPVFHGLQYLPFYFDRVATFSRPLLISSILVISSFLLIQFFPSQLDRLIIGAHLSMNVLFVCVLIFFNLHHFAMEAFTWKKRG